MNTKNRTFFCLLVFLLPLVFPVLLPSDAGACTVLTVNGVLTDDGRPIFGKEREPADSNQRQYVHRYTNYGYWYIAVNNAMGVNEHGFATSNAASTVVASGTENFSVLSLGDDALNQDTVQGDGLMQLQSTTSGWYYDPATTVIDAGKFTINTLAGCITVDDFHDHVEEIYGYGNSFIRSNYAVIDTLGGSWMYEFNQNIWWREYEAVNPNRIAQNTYGFVVRPNSWHFRDDGTDNIAVTGDRYESGRVNLQGMLAEKGHISVRLLARGTAGPNEGYEYFRYGPGRPLAPLAPPANRSSIMVHGVLPDEDPALSTMWTALGPINYSIFVPTWVMIRTVPESMKYENPAPLCPNPNYQHFSDRALSLFNKGEEQIIQESTFPLEKHIFDEVLDVLLPHWRTFGTPSRDTFERVCHRIAADAYSLLYCLDLVRNNNKAPVVDFDILPKEMTLHFTLDAFDPDGQIESVLWDFGDNSTSPQPSPSRTYTTPGDYLISCTVTDDEGVSNTKWAYFQVPFSCDLTGNEQVGLGDLGFLAQSWLDACSEPYWCDGSDLNQSGSVDLQDIAIFSNGWLAD